MRSGSDPAKRGIALSWLFHLIGDVHQPLHAVQLFTREYPKGDRSGGDFCVRVAQDRAAVASPALGWTDHVEQQRWSVEKDRSRPSQQVFLIEIQGTRS